MKVRKPKSKRLTCRKKFKIMKKVREHNKKLRKTKLKRVPKKDPGVPNSHPNKLQLLKSLKNEYDTEKQVNKIAKNLHQYIAHVEEKHQTYENLAHDMKQSVEIYHAEKILNQNLLKNNNSMDDFDHENLMTDKFHNSKDYLTVIENSDIICEVIDARDPLGTRSQSLEDLVLSKGKSLILILNKIDLVPKNIVFKWLNYLNKFYPTVAFKSCLDFKKFVINKSCDFEQKINCSNSIVCVGAETLIKAIKSCSDFHVVTIGIVGYPNVGKSSVINSLARSYKSIVGCMPGVTKSIKSFKLTDNITVIDSPGVIIQSDPQQTTNNLTYFLSKTNSKDACDVAHFLYLSSEHSQLKNILNIPEFKSFDEFLTVVSRRFGKLKKGGLPDHEAASRSLVNFCLKGKLRFYYEPPEMNNQISIVSQLKPRFTYNDATEEISRVEDLTDNFISLKLTPKDVAGVVNKETFSMQIEEPSSRFHLKNRQQKLMLESKPVKSSLKKKTPKSSQKTVKFI